MKHAIYYRPDGRIQSATSFQESVTPPEREGLTLMVLDAPLANPAAWRVVDGELEAYVHVPSEDELLRQIRRQRNHLLAATDWTDTASAPTRLGATLYGEWQAYRQALRDITLQEDPITWPTPPEI